MSILGGIVNEKELVTEAAKQLPAAVEPVVDRAVDRATNNLIAGFRALLDDYNIRVGGIPIEFEKKEKSS